MEDQCALSGFLRSVHGEERKTVLSLLRADSCSPPLAPGYGLFSHQVASQFSVDSNRGPLKDNSEMSTRTVSGPEDQKLCPQDPLTNPFSLKSRC